VSAGALIAEVRPRVDGIIGEAVTDRSAPTSSDRLSGWKEVAAYVGKSVRSAQRWEAELGLPVERLIGPDGGQIVQASRAAIDAWLRARTAEGLATDAGLAEEDGATETVEAPTETVGLRDDDATRPAPNRLTLRASNLRRLALPLAMLIVGLAAGAALAVALMPIVANPTSFEVNGRRIVATTESGRLVWSHELSRIASYPPQLGSSRPDEGDLDGDGSFEVAVGVSYADPRHASVDASDEVLIFSRRGRLLHSIQPNISLARAGVTYSGPWRLLDMAFSVAGRGRLWLAFTNSTTDWTFVLEVTANGSPLVRLVHEGSVRAMAHWQPPTGEDYLLIGGTEGQTKLAWVGAADLNGAPVRWPPTSALACQSCPTAAPAVSILLPRSELMTALHRAIAQVFRIRVIRDQFLAEVDVGAGRFEMYEFDQRFALVSHRFLPQYDLAHREQERTGVLTHPIDACPERRNQPDVRWWDAGGGWIARQPPPRATNASDD
jgi:hypothetical protein